MSKLEISLRIEDQTVNTCIPLLVSNPERVEKILYLLKGSTENMTPGQTQGLYLGGKPFILVAAESGEKP